MLWETLGGALLKPVQKCRGGVSEDSMWELNQEKQQANRGHLSECFSKESIMSKDGR